MKQSTLLFLIKKSGTVVTEICLAMKKRGMGTGKWNGVGGKVETGEGIEDAARRETAEEIGVQVGELSKVAEITFYYAAKPEWNQVVHIFFVQDWHGEPVESEEMRPEWYTVNALPYDSMWPDDAIWLPKVLAGEFVKGEVRFAADNQIISHTL